ncbi:Dihydrolipoyllysine-residue acetyltransferase [Tetrabaena socialis]|uniref:Dihydrolipoamide acetyltransferase component of pyruvate dehydrogenase complex n=1 Tax=Tetrabaena socialis TaxID=47790 RepID=A0A2J8A8H4_9CHLO|nr:Dihydrolipoyllysine-residue acetyltransferase [Tetrabaena socialis]|eukprot:PNH08810.1 Dihydrolipoyllysine-residue acetyltransferase [Tetrabaena socialis]
MSGARRLAQRLVRRALQPQACQEASSSWARLAGSTDAGARFYAAYPPHVVLNMPSLSPTMTQGNIIKWRKQPGEQVAPGHILADVETDKASIEWEAQEEGFMAKHLVPAASGPTLSLASCTMSGARRLAQRLVRRALQPQACQEASSSWARLAGSTDAGARFYAAYPPHVVLNMPSLSPTMTQGNIIKWRKQPGEQVAPGHILADVETDKASIEWEAQEEGFMAKHLVPEGTRDIAVGAPVAVLAEESDGLAALASFAPGDAAGPAAPAPSAPPAPGPSPPASAAKPVGSSLPPHQVLNMPALSPTMSSGNIVSWNKKVGDSVAPGDVYCEVETDKATMAWECQEEGFIAKILFGDGSKDISIGTPVVVLVEDKGALAAFQDYAGAPAESAAPAAAAASTASAAPAAAPAAASAAPVKPTGPAPVAASGGRLRSSPFARRVAAELGVDLQAVSGTGPSGRVVAADVRAAQKSAAAAPAPSAAAPSGAGASADGGSFVDIPHSQIRRVVARRLLESKQTVPHYYLTMECQVEELVQLRERMNALAAGGGKGGREAGGAFKLSVNDFVLKAAAKALKAVPGVNSSWHPDFIRQHSNSAILAVGASTPVVARVGGVFREVPTMAVTLSCDHRVIDGAMGAEWLAAFKQSIENPLSAVM